MGAAEGASVDIALDLMDEEEAHGARQLYMALVFLTEDSALRLVQSVEDSKGCTALRKIINTCAPVTQGRVLATLNGILAADFGQDPATFMDRLVVWERRIQDFERLAKEPLSDIIKRAITTERAPADVRTHLLVNAGALKTYEAVRSSIEAYLAAGRKWSPEQPSSMEVDALYGKGKYGKGKYGKGKEKGKGKYGKQDKGKGKGKDKEGKGKSEKFEGY